MVTLFPRSVDGRHTTSIELIWTCENYLSWLTRWEKIKKFFFVKVSFTKKYFFKKKIFIKKIFLPWSIKIETTKIRDMIDLYHISPPRSKKFFFLTKNKNLFFIFFFKKFFLKKNKKIIFLFLKNNFFYKNFFIL